MDTSLNDTLTFALTKDFSRCTLATSLQGSVWLLEQFYSKGVLCQMNEVFFNRLFQTIQHNRSHPAPPIQGL